VRPIYMQTGKEVGEEQRMKIIDANSR
jgi:hypothetical protein